MLNPTTEKSYLNRPQAQGITVRQLQFNPKAIHRHYFANSPVMSAFADRFIFNFSDW